MKYAKRNHLRLFYEVYGSDGGSPLLLIMGLGMPMVAWSQNFIDLLVAQGFKVIVFDNRDSGRSSVLPGDVRAVEVVEGIFRALVRQKVKSTYSLEDMADDAIAVLDDLSIDRAHVLGISMGGMIGQVLAVRYPQRLLTLTSIMSASGNPRTGLGTVRALRGLLKKPSNSRDVDCLTQYLRNVFQVIGSGEIGYSNEHIRSIAQYMVDNHYRSEATSRQLLAILSSGDRSEQLKKISVPTLVIHGKQDPLLPLEAGREVASLIPGARLLEIDGMGHDLPTSKLDFLIGEVGKHCLSQKS